MVTQIILYTAGGILALGFGVVAYLWWQASIKPAAYKEMFEVIERKTDLADGVENDLIDERSTHRLNLEGAVNFRDIGGYHTADGQRVALGRVYRSDELFRLTEKDIQTIQDLGIKLICDLRSFPEIETRPDRLPETVAYQHLPVFVRDPIGPVRVVFLRHRLDSIFKRFYRISIIDQGASVLGEALRLAANPDNLPLLLHCTGGKDRTGVASALLLHICGVPHETIVMDYSLTNLGIEKFLANIREAISHRRRLPGFRIEQLYPLLSARPELIEHALAHIEERYGSIGQYLRGPAGLTEEELVAIRRNLLVS